MRSRSDSDGRGRLELPVLRCSDARNTVPPLSTAQRRARIGLVGLSAVTAVLLAALAGIATAVKPRVHQAGRKLEPVAINEPVAVVVSVSALTVPVKPSSLARTSAESSDRTKHSEPGSAALRGRPAEPRVSKHSRGESPEVHDPSGAELFARIWQPNDARSHGGDGLGPLYNAESCLGCHNQGGPGGGGPLSRNVDLITAPSTPITFTGGTDALGVMQPTLIISQEEWAKIHPAFLNASSIVLHRFGVSTRYHAVRDTLLRQTYHPKLLTRSGFSRLSQRNSPPLFGAGRIDAIPDSILVGEAARQAGGSSAGRVHKLGNGRVGRFGWQAQVATLDDFVRAACANELGLEVPGRHQAVSPASLRQKTPPALDMDEAECKALVAYVRDLPAPRSISASNATVSADIESGQHQFRAIGCAYCHVPNMGRADGIYSDLLLHEMGSQLAESGTYYGPDSAAGSAADPFPASLSEWRTAPLWGFRDSAPYLHDGRANTLDEAVAQHAGQAASSTIAYFKLKQSERRQILAFLNSLVAPGTVGGPPEPAPADRAANSEEFYVEKRRHDIRLKVGATLRMYLTEDFDTQLRTGHNLEKLGKPQAAIYFYNQVIKSAPESVSAREAVARIRAIKNAAN